MTKKKKITKAKVKAPTKKVKLEPLPYGPVTVTGGQYEGIIGYYDDDDERNRLIIYPEVAWLSGYILVARKWCREATAAEEKLYNDLFDNDIVKKRALKKLREKWKEQK